MAQGDVYIGLGSNMGNRAENLRMALGLMPPLVRVEAVSSLYETAPVGFEDQPHFLNAVARVTTGLQPLQLLRHLKGIETDIGRRPGPHWGPRPIDLDILLMGDRVVRDAELVVPHPRMYVRSFVLAPLADLAPDLVPPEMDEPVTALRDAASMEGVRLVAGPEWLERGRGSWLRWT
ncbi:MAG TPA: 2-amino-4-hydroxy-6-hydroxymethyldihydropteridine diphosphokinase [Dehalococcoidia bacterium]|nr:2-amino-4-hydroxy-6-hydroxymethyldihydropteridine diphosphokinase [Dehalococcoidia bacterium]